MCILRPHESKNPYELWFGKKGTMRYFKVFGSKCYIKRIEKNIGKFEDRANGGIFLGYSTNSKAYKCYNKKLRKIVKSVDVKVNQKRELKKNDDDENFPFYEEVFEWDEEEKIEKLKLKLKSKIQKESKIDFEEYGEDENMKFKIGNWKKDHPREQIIGELKSSVQIRRKHLRTYSLFSSIEPKNVIETSQDES